jgi:formylglycine-generating enzyme required for sulfatase activity
MQVAKLAANNSQNWNTSTVGSGGMFRGHSDNDPTNALAASSNDDNGYYNTNNVAPSIERRTLHIEDGVLGNDPDVADSYNGTVWDLGGNVYEWNNDTLDCTGGNPCAEMPDPEGGWQELTGLTDAGTYLGTFELLRPNSQWNNSENMGSVYTDSFANPIHAFRRGGAWHNGANAGAFALRLTSAPSHSNTYIGFRCSYVP